MEGTCHNSIFLLGQAWSIKMSQWETFNSSPLDKDTFHRTAKDFSHFSFRSVRWQFSYDRGNATGKTGWVFVHSVLQRSEAKNPSKFQNMCNFYVLTVDFVKIWGHAHPVFKKLRRPWQSIQGSTLIKGAQYFSSFEISQPKGQIVSKVRSFSIIFLKVHVILCI